MSIEGLWAVQTNQPENPKDWTEGGVAVLESQRIYGGGEMNAITGKYAVRGDDLIAECRMWTWNFERLVSPGYEDDNAFGKALPIDMTISVVLRRDGEYWRGLTAPADGSAEPFGVRLKKIADFPE